MLKDPLPRPYRLAGGIILFLGLVLLYLIAFDGFLSLLIPASASLLFGMLLSFADERVDLGRDTGTVARVFLLCKLPVFTKRSTIPTGARVSLATELGIETRSRTTFLRYAVKIQGAESVALYQGPSLSAAREVASAVSEFLSLPLDDRLGPGDSATGAAETCFTAAANSESDAAAAFEIEETEDGALISIPAPSRPGAKLSCGFLVVWFSARLVAECSSSGLRVSPGELLLTGFVYLTALILILDLLLPAPTTLRISESGLRLKRGLLRTLWGLMPLGDYERAYAIVSGRDARAVFVKGKGKQWMLGGGWSAAERLRLAVSIERHVGRARHRAGIYAGTPPG